MIADIPAAVAERPAEKALYPQVLGPWFHRLAPVLAWVHDGSEQRLTGQLRVRTGRNPLVRVLLRVAGMPIDCEAAPSEVVLTPRGGGERWDRRIGQRRMLSRQGYGRPGVVVERVGPLAIHLATRVHDRGLMQRSLYTTLFGVRLPAALGLKIVACERPIDEHSFRFDVRLRSGLLGCVLHYRGVLHLAEPGRVS